MANLHLQRMLSPCIMGFFFCTAPEEWRLIICWCHIIVVEELHQYSPLKQKTDILQLIHYYCSQSSSRHLHIQKVACLLQLITNKYLYMVAEGSTSSGILSRVLINWTSVLTILQAELLHFINVPSLSEELISFHSLTERDSEFRRDFTSITSSDWE